MFRFAGVSASARPFEISGIALAMPPVPVLVPAPAPVRLNHSSSVKLWAFSVGAEPKVTYWVDPFSCRPRPAAMFGVAVASADAGERFAEASTATTT